MSNLRLNVRFGIYHLKIGRDCKYWVSVVRNEYHAKNKPATWFEIY